MLYYEFVCILYIAQKLEKFFGYILHCRLVYDILKFEIEHYDFYIIDELIPL